MQTSDLAEDLLDGADEIAAFLGWKSRRVFYAAERDQIPVVRVGKRLTARKSTLRQHFAGEAA